MGGLVVRRRRGRARTGVRRYRRLEGGYGLARHRSLLKPPRRGLLPVVQERRLDQMRALSAWISAEYRAYLIKAAVTEAQGCGVRDSGQRGRGTQRSAFSAQSS